jgi:hypothetical protein
MRLRGVWPPDRQRPSTACDAAHRRGLLRVVMNGSAGREQTMDSQEPNALTQTDTSQDEALPTDRPTRPRRASHRSRRLSDNIRDAFNDACEQRDLDAADRLLRVLELMLKRRPLEPPIGLQRQRDKEAMVAAHELLWRLRHPDAGEACAPDPLYDDAMD